MMYHETGNAGLVCTECGISRPTLRKWLRRYEEAGEDGLKSQSRRPLNSPKRKISEAVRTEILRLRAEHKGARRIQNELRFHDHQKLSLATIHKVLLEACVKPLVRPRRRVRPKRHSRPFPGNRVQMDTMKIATGVYQYTAIDECSRFRVLAVYARRSARNTVRFLERVIEEMPFPIRCIQTDHGAEFFAETVQRRLVRERIKFRPIPLGSPQRNSRVERSQIADLDEFWTHHVPGGEGIDQRIAEWQFNCNWQRPQGCLRGKTPVERIAELLETKPLAIDMDGAHDRFKVRIERAADTANGASKDHAKHYFCAPKIASST